ncbi:hypothetical protein EOE18_04965 [Novosphingobium umbonatum]|uniref:DUF883 family protein n=1 Tax=Novosphingobium umbonatum TaxID=1908524 RepID=A0A437N8E2_9SPHN|nr:hypothetical protein [Novosphingobium umbonatum]RVU06195.1 hypothetical protein EOE18_04965 [Novosphingobium umbonatum]
MADETTAPLAPEAVAETVAATGETVSAKFSKALEDAKASAVALGKDLQEKAAPYREKLEDKLSSADLAAEARAIGEQAKERALALAAEGKVKASDALSGLGKLFADNASVVDDKLGAKYGDYARTAARSIQETAAKLESKELDELGKDAVEFVKKNPAVAIGAAAVVGFALAKLLGGGGEEAVEADNDAAE